VIPENLRFGGGTAGTFLSPVVLLAVIIAGVMICFSTRRKALAAFLAAAILIPPDQVLLVAGMHFPMTRLLALFGLVRILRGRFLGKGAIFSGGMNGIDKALIVLNLFMLINGVLLWHVWGQLVFQLGILLNFFGAYFLLRFLVRDIEDVVQALRVLAGVALVVALVMVGEQLTGKNLLYSTLGGARADELGSVIVRGDHLRAAGPFEHPILAGTFGGILLPLFVGLSWRERKDRKYAALGIAAVTVISFTASSSTALLGFLGGIVGLCSWPLRLQMRWIRWGIVGTLVSLHLYMKSPVWHLISYVDFSGGSSSYHRYQLINQCILHFQDWALVGTKDYASWGWDMWDLSNQYVAIADTTGLIPLLSFLAILVFGFRYLGKARRSAGDRKQQFFIWALGASLFANVVAFFGISYFDQTIVAWYALLAMIHAATISVRRGQRDSTLPGSKGKVLAMTFDSDREGVGVEVHPPTSVTPLVGGPSELGFSRGSLR
jgi:hypothetical protein